MKIHEKQSARIPRKIPRKIYQQVLILLLALSMIGQPLAAQDGSATYSITFEATWSADSPHPHPDGTDSFPGSAHFSPLIGAVHSADIFFWELGGIATPGIESMAELGSASKLRAEVEAEIANGAALAVINGPDVSPSPGTATITELQVTAEHPLITLVTMIAPSSDWFLGVSGLSLMGEDGWKDEVVVELHGYDAGTEEGISFSLGNDPTDPYAPIQQLSEVVLGKFTFTRTDGPPAPPSAEDPLPDLAFERVTMEPSNPQIGDEVTIRVSILNQGDIIDSGFQVHLYWNSADRPPTSTTEETTQTSFNLGIEPGETFEWVRKVNVISEDLSYYVWIDRDNKVAESDEENNLYTHIATIPTPTPQPTAEATPTPSYDSPDTYEEDDSCRQASEIDTEGTAQMHNLYLTEEDVDGDHDWVRFEAASGIKYHVVAQPHSEHGTDAMIVLEVTLDCENPPGTLGDGGAELIFTPEESGIHYILVRHDEKTYGPKTDYMLNVVAENSCIDIYEPNDSCPRSNDLLVDHEAQTYRFCQRNDVDWMQFEGRAGLEYKFSVENLGGNADAQIEVHGNCEPGPSALSQESLQFHAIVDGPIYLRLANRENDRYGMDTEYTVKVEQIGDSDCGPDEYEDDDTLDDAREIDVASGTFTQVHNICPANDADWSRFQASTGKTYLIETIDLGDAADPVICLYDSEQALIQCDTDSGPGRAARLVWQAENDGTYYLQLHDEDDGVAGPETSYTLHVTTDLCEDAAHEPNDNVDQAGTITQGSEGQGHTFCQEGDEDWMKFEASAGNYVIAAASQNPSDVDTVLALYDGDDNLLDENNDHGTGFGSMLEYEIKTPGIYYILAYAHDPDTYGRSVEYTVSVQYEPSPTATPKVTPSPTPYSTPPPPPPSTEIRTLILVNQKRLSTLYDEEMAAQVQEKLQTLAGHERVQGEIVQLHENTIVSDAYAAWQGNLNDVQYANQVADAIKRLILAYMDQHGGIEYVVLVGDDRALPFRRVLDPTARERHDFTEREYAEKAGGDHPTAASLRGDYILTDDFYIDLAPEKFYVPDVDLAVGRLIETPEQIITTIDQFLGNPNTTVERVLVTGYDFLIDAGENMCTRWQSDVTDTSKINCGLIGEQWDGERLRQAQADETYQIQAINGHAFHDLEVAPDTKNVSAQAIASGSSDMGGSLLYTLGCHSGLNLPGTLDLAEAFISRGGTYIGNTGFGWGYRGGVGLSERLMKILTDNLVAGTEVSIGKALTDAKNTYIMGEPLLNGYDEKVVQQVILYGLPMHHIKTSESPESALLDDPEVTFTIDTPSRLAPLTDTDNGTENDVVVAEISVARQADSFSEGPAATSEGNFYELDGDVSIQPGRPIIPAHYSENVVQSTGSPVSNARAAIVKSGRYTIENDFEAIIASPYNEFVLAQDASPDTMTGWWPELPTTLRHQGNSAQVISHFAQYDAESRRLRLFEDIKGEVYFSDSPDEVGPEIALVSGLYFTATTVTTIKVGVTDPSGIRAVFVSWFEEDESGSGNIRTQALTHEENSIRWQGSIDSDLALGFFIQAVDGAGNVTAAHNDGSYYEPSVAAARRTVIADKVVYLPVIVR